MNVGHHATSSLTIRDSKFEGQKKKSVYHIEMNDTIAMASIRNCPEEPNHFIRHVPVTNESWPHLYMFR